MAKKPVSQIAPIPANRQGDGRFPRPGSALTASYVASLERRIQALEAQTRFGVGGISGRGVATPVTPGYGQTIKFAVAAPEVGDPFKAYPLEFVVNAGHTETRDQRMFGQWRSMEDHGGSNRATHTAIRLNFSLWDEGDGADVENHVSSYSGDWVQHITSTDFINSFFPVKGERYPYVQCAPGLLMAIPFAIVRSGVLLQDMTLRSYAKVETVSGSYTTLWQVYDNPDYNMVTGLVGGANIKAMFNTQTRVFEIISAVCSY